MHTAKSVPNWDGNDQGARREAMPHSCQNDAERAAWRLHPNREAKHEFHRR